VTTERAAFLLGLGTSLLEQLEWSGHIWTDTECCPMCGATVDGLPGTDKYPEERPKTHRDDCLLAKTLGLFRREIGL
jgi:hypothetical protein